MTIRNTCEYPREIAEPILVKEITPSVDLRIDLDQLLEKETLGSLDPEQIAAKLLLPSGKKDLVDGNMVWLRVHPHADDCTYELSDPLASDLEKCDKVFAIVNRYQDHIGDLPVFAAPSFPGNRAIVLLSNLMALTQIQAMFFGDGSTLLASTNKSPPCCDSGALTSLRLIGAFAGAKSWYESQGARAEIPAKAFESLALDHLLKESDDRRLRKWSPQEFDRMVCERRSLILSEFQPSLKAYRSACQFLHSLPIHALIASLKPLSGGFPQLLNLQRTLHTASSEISCSSTLGELVTSMMKAKNNPALHELHHEIRDLLVSFKDAAFSQYITHVLSTHETSDELSCMLAWCALADFLSGLRNCKYSQKETCDIVFGLLNVTDTKLDALSQKVCEDASQKLTPDAAKGLGEKKEKALPIGRQIQKFFLEKTKKSNDPVCVKICAHSNHSQREKWIEYQIDWAGRGNFFSAQQAIQHLARLSVKRLACIYPELAEKLKNHFHPSDEMTLGDLMKSPDPQQQGWILDELVCGGAKHVSSLFVHYLDTHPLKAMEPDKIYALFSIAKIICRWKDFFIFRM